MEDWMKRKILRLHQMGTSTKDIHLITGVSGDEIIKLIRKYKNGK